MKIEKEVYICFDGPSGLVIQTNIGTYTSYYKKLGWELIGRAEPLPGMQARTYQRHVESADEDEVFLPVDSIGGQSRLF